jgi:8-oxo-dGTP diphosphatase
MDRTVEVEVEVVAAVRRPRNGKFWVCKRGTNGSHAGLKGKWEFPGGKVEPGEPQRAAVVREMAEEFDAVVSVGRFLDRIKSPHEGKVYAVNFYEVNFLTEPVLKEHTEAGWFSPEEMAKQEHLPSGTAFINQKLLSGRRHAAR